MQRIENTVQHGLAIPGRIVIDHPDHGPGGVIGIAGESGDRSHILQVTGLDATLAIHAGVAQAACHGSIHRDDRH